MRKSIVLILLLFISLGTKAQFSINYSVGYGDYKMSDLKALTQLAFDLGKESEQLPQGLRLVDNFPAYVTHTMDALYRIKMHEFGVKASYLTTGSKMAYSDYSGSYIEKIVTNGYRVGLMYRVHFHTLPINNKNYKVSFLAELSPALLFSSLKTEGEIKIYDVNNEQSKENFSEDKIKKTAYSIQPLAGTQLALYKHFLFTMTAGYDFSLGAKLNPLHRIDWSGFRFNLGVGYAF